MIYGSCVRRGLKLIAISMLPLFAAGCLQIFNSGTSGGLVADVGVASSDAGGQGRASACDLLNEYDLRASRRDTPATQKLLFGLQRQKLRCVEPEQAGGLNVGE